MCNNILYYPKHLLLFNLTKDENLSAVVVRYIKCV